MDNNINQNLNNNMKKNTRIGIFIVLFICLFIGSTYAYYFYSSSNSSSITGDAGEIYLGLSVDKVLPNTDGVDDILIINFDELASSLNSQCADDEYALCQLYKITLTNNSSDVNTNVDGNIAFDNENAPNLSWILLGNTYSSSTTYTSTMLGNTFNTSSSDFTSFVSNYLLDVGESVDFYILVWINESDGEQLDDGGYTGTIRFNGVDGEGVTATFGTNS